LDALVTLAVYNLQSQYDQQCCARLKISTEITRAVITRDACGGIKVQKRKRNKGKVEEYTKSAEQP